MRPPPLCSPAPRRPASRRRRCASTEDRRPSSARPAAVIARSSCTTTTTSSRPTHSTNGRHPRSNPPRRLVWALATLKDANDRITIDGLWDHVRPATEADVALLERLPFDEDGIRRIHGIDSFVRGLSGTPLKLKHFFEPTCTICGLTSGYSGPGSKTVLPAVASAKLDFRLVPDLDPELVARLLRAHLDARGFKDVEVTPMHGE